MRYDTPIYFCTAGQSTYDAETGDYTDADPIEVERMAAVMPTSDEKIQIVYGQMMQGSLTVHLQNHYDDSFDYLRIGEHKYHVDSRKRLRVKDVFVVSEVM